MAWSGADLDDLIDSSHVVSIPLVTPFRGLSHREVMLFDGEAGTGEWAAFVEYDDEEASWWLASALEQAFDDEAPSLPHGVDSVRVNATFPALEPAEVPGWWKKFPGVTSAKVKVAEPGQLLIDDLARVAAVRKAIGDRVSLRLDANAHWEVAEADQALFMLRAFTIDYVEQPVNSVSDMARLRERLQGTGVRLAADELIRKHGALDQVISERAADIAVLKVSPLGGLWRTLHLAHKAHEAGMEVVISSGLETSVGLGWGVRAQAILQNQFGEMPDAGLGTACFFTTDTTTAPLKVKDGSVSTVTPLLDPRKIKKIRADEERTQWWHERLRHCLPRAMELLAEGQELPVA